jgi:hypothetical protein
MSINITGGPSYTATITGARSLSVTASLGDLAALKKASNLSDLSNTTTALVNLGGTTSGISVFTGTQAQGRTALGLGSAATQSSSAFDTAGAAAAAQSAASSDATAKVAAEAVIRSSADIANLTSAQSYALTQAGIAQAFAIQRANHTGTQAATTIGSGAVSDTEFSYLDGVTSALQTQIDAKLSSATAAATYQPLDSDLTAIAALATTTYGRSLLTPADASAGRSWQARRLWRKQQQQPTRRPRPMQRKQRQFKGLITPGRRH